MTSGNKDLKVVATRLMDVIGPVSRQGYIEGKARLQDALKNILDAPEDAAEVLSSLRARGHVRFVNRVGRDVGEAHWRLVKNPLSQN